MSRLKRLRMRDELHSYQKGSLIGGGAIAFLAAATMLAGCAGAPGTPPLAPDG